MTLGLWHSSALYFYLGFPGWPWLPYCPEEGEEARDTLSLCCARYSSVSAVSPALHPGHPAPEGLKASQRKPLPAKAEKLDLGQFSACPPPAAPMPPAPSRLPESTVCFQQEALGQQNNLIPITV